MITPVLLLGGTIWAMALQRAYCFTLMSSSARLLQQHRRPLSMQKERANIDFPIPWPFPFKKEDKVAPPVFPTIVVSNNYNVAAGCLALSVPSIAADNIGLAAFFILLGGFLTLQTSKIRFVFDNEAMEVCVLKKSENNSNSDSNEAAVLGRTRENFAVGGQNRWKYSSFRDWYFIPSKDFPILMYFFETQTKPEGQIHFFPVITNGKQLYDTMMERIGPVSPKNQST